MELKLVNKLICPASRCENQHNRTRTILLKDGLIFHLVKVAREPCRVNSGFFLDYSFKTSFTSS